MGKGTSCSLSFQPSISFLFCTCCLICMELSGDHTSRLLPEDINYLTVWEKALGRSFIILATHVELIPSFQAMPLIASDTFKFWISWELWGTICSSVSLYTLLYILQLSITLLCCWKKKNRFLSLFFSHHKLSSNSNVLIFLLSSLCPYRFTLKIDHYSV